MVKQGLKALPIVARPAGAALQSMPTTIAPEHPLAGSGCQASRWDADDLLWALGTGPEGPAYCRPPRWGGGTVPEKNLVTPVMREPAGGGTVPEGRTGIARGFNPCNGDGPTQARSQRDHRRDA